MERPRRRPLRPRVDLRHQSVLPEWLPEDDETYRCTKVTGATTGVSSLTCATFDRMQLERVSFRDARLTSVIFTDALLQNCDLAGVKAESSSMLRTEIVDSRLTGGSWSECTLRHVCFRSCRMQYASFRQQKFGAGLFEDCDLRDSDFQAADLRGATFVRCDLTHVQLSNASLDGARFEDCSLDLARGVGALRGATMGVKEMLSLAPSMAAALGITIDTDQVPAADPDA